MTLTPTENLEAEHQIILKVASAMAIVVKKLKRGARVNPDLLTDIAEFMRVYGDRLHHGKEEKELFPALLKKGVPAHGCPIGALTYEHALGRTLVQKLMRATASYRKGSAAAKKPLIQALEGLAELYPGHIWKEDFLLFPMTNKVLTAKDQKALAARFKAVEQSIGKDVAARFAGLARRLQTAADHPN